MIGRGKAGGYAIQGLAARFIRDIAGSYSNIVGFSLYDVAALLDAAGWHHDFQQSDKIIKNASFRNNPKVNHDPGCLFIL